MKTPFFAIALLLSIGCTARAQDITAETDAPNSATVFSPKTADRVRSQNASLVYWRVFPVLVQSLDKNNKHAALKVEIHSPLDVNRKATLSINVDGRLYSASPVWTDASTSLSERTMVALIDLHDEPGSLSLRVMASASAISVTEMHYSEQITVRLVGQRLDVFKTMYAKYTELSPRQGPASTDSEPTSARGAP
ncbi:MAG: hypothetical protein WAK91_11740 [Candidatus Acidiferrales bacterium]|jgi:hypothetical protein